MSVNEPDNTPLWARQFLSQVSAGGVHAVATPRPDVGLAKMSARKGQEEALTARVREVYGITLADGPKRATCIKTAFLGIGPGNWLATSTEGGNEFADTLAENVKGLASVTDQTDAHLIVSLSGPNVRRVLEKMIPIDLDPRAFAVGDVASTVAHHMGVTIWRVEDDVSGASVFETAVYRGFARDYWHFILTCMGVASEAAD